MSFLEEILQVKRYITDAEQVYERLKPRGEPSPLLVALPLLYQRYIAQSGTNDADERFVAFASQYLATRFPEVKEYFISPQQRERVQEFHQTLDRFFEEKHAALTAEGLENRSEENR